MGSALTVDHFDILVLGSGEAGKYIAWSQASAGRRAAVIERRYTGGSCPNIACLPSKNVIHSAKVVHYGANARVFGLRSTTPPQVDMTAVRDRKRTMVRGLVEMHEDRFRQTGTELIIGNGRFVGPRMIAVEDISGHERTLTADIVIVSTGSRARIEDIPGLREAAPLTHIELLEIEEVPAHLIILGGGYVGMEFAQAMRRFGSEVTVIEHHQQVLNREDDDISSALKGILEKEGVKFCTSTVIERVQGRSGRSVTLTGSQAGKAFSTTGTHLLVASGRTPNTDNIGLEKAGIATTKHGFVEVGEHLRTSATDVFAVGDCAGSPHFTHVAYDDFRIVRETLAGRSRSTKGRQIPYTLFTDPELAHVGLSESVAKARDIPYRLAKLPMKAFLRTRTLGQEEGFAKALISASDDKILGFTALGPGVGELLAPIQLAMEAGLPYTSLANLVLTHPTLSEGLVYLFSSVPAWA